jgi:hypothetical protein
MPHPESGAAAVAEEQAFVDSNFGPDVLHVSQGVIESLSQNSFMPLASGGKHEIVGKDARRGSRMLDQVNPRCKVKTNESHRQWTALGNTARMMVLLAQSTSNGVTIRDVIVKSEIGCEELVGAPSFSE